MVGSSAVRQYLYIDQDFYNWLLDENPLAAKNLTSMCDRRKVINKSKGRKGILIAHDKVKVKDCTKDYRFFGRAVASTRLNDKTYNLSVVNGYKSNHKTVTIQRKR